MNIEKGHSLYCVPNLFMKFSFEDITILTDALIMYKIQQYETKTKQSPLISPKISVRQMSCTALPFYTLTLANTLPYTYDHPKEKDNHEILYSADG